MSGRNHSRPSRHRSTQECQCHQFSSSLILVSSSHVGFTFSRWISRRGAVSFGRDVLRVLRLKDENDIHVLEEVPTLIGTVRANTTAGGGSGVN
eukprot:scaffold55510_cov37-Cyclotella_meneghiniana.AAC.4